MCVIHLLESVYFPTCLIMHGSCECSSDRRPRQGPLARGGLRARARARNCPGCLPLLTATAPPHRRTPSLAHHPYTRQLFFSSDVRTHTFVMFLLLFILVPLTVCYYLFYTHTWLDLHKKINETLKINYPGWIGTLQNPKHFRDKNRCVTRY